MNTDDILKKINDTIENIDDKTFLKIWNDLFEDEEITLKDVNSDLREELEFEIKEEISLNHIFKKTVKLYNYLFDEEITEHDIDEFTFFDDEFTFFDDDM